MRAATETIIRQQAWDLEPKETLIFFVTFTLCHDMTGGQHISSGVSWTTTLYHFHFLIGCSKLGASWDIMLDNSCMLYDATLPKNILRNTGDIGSHLEGCNHFTTSKSLQEKRICWILCGIAITLFALFWFLVANFTSDLGLTDEKQPCW